MESTIERVGVVGAGMMGAEIALVFALAGHDVLLADRANEALDGAMERLSRALARGAERGYFAEAAVETSLTRIATTTDLGRLADRQFVTEAVFEREDVKTEVLARLDAALPAGAVIATNTSTIPISVLASSVAPGRRANVIGTHYFSPASRMRLVEIIPGLETSAETQTITFDLMQAVGKTAVRVKDVPGFAVNRLLHVMMIEAVRLVEEGVATPADIDTACRLGLGHPMGPFELMDATTSSLCLQAQEIMHDAYGERFRPRPLLKQRVRAGLIGGRGKPGWRTPGQG
ncbi:MAG: 3-hydroxyacyl-CoA dehydrogenase family protein [Rhizobiaceae bacterium]